MKDINLFKTEDSIYLKKVRTKADVSGDCDGYLIEGSLLTIDSIIKRKEFVGTVIRR